LVKPFELPELLARIRALLRRSRVATAPRVVTLDFEDLHLDATSREVRRGDLLLQLTPREFSLLEYFMRHPRQVLTREQILESVWGYDHEGSSNVVDVFVRQLRDKTEAAGASRLLQTVRGVGYVLKAE
ncbi:MAG: response regulator transcription factor, partial [Candidatus Eremiobacteraeota bacterium]|nr:response regulator transcription factor [Candidatus Eremiobacteraeota bacterium]